MSSARHPASLPTLLALPLLAIGCSSGRKDPVLLDARPIPDAAPVECLLPASLGTVTPANQDGHSAMAQGSTTPDNYYLYADLNADPKPDVLLIDLYKGFGAFPTDFPTAPTTISIAGDETSYDTCGACILAQTDLDMTSMSFTGDPYFATAGTLQLTSASPTSIAGTLVNITLTHATIDPDSNVTTPLNDGCSSTLDSLAFSATPVAGVNGHIHFGITVPKRARL